MDKEVEFKKLFGLTSTITDTFPKVGARFLDALIISALGNKILASYITNKANRVLKRIRQFNKILFVSDLNIGDAIISSCGISALRKIFPESEIDFVIKESTKVLMEGNPDVSNLYSIYNHAPYPTENDLIKLSNVVNQKSYDLIINYCPMISSNFFGNKKTISYNLMATELIKNERRKDSINHINYESFKFIVKTLKDFAPPALLENFKGAKIFISEMAVLEAKEFLIKHNLNSNKPLIMLNPDASAVYTRIPFDFQINLLKELSYLQYDILIGAGHVEKNIEKRIIERLSLDSEQKIVLIPPSLELDTYAALIDFADVFITGDTGPLHIAAARKYNRSTGKSMRNSTAVFSIFGSTPPHIYGYDSINPTYLPANQDSPSRTFIAKSVCRNISCINKMGKTCKEIRCFDNLSIDEIVTEINSYLSTLKRFYFPKERSIFAE